MPNANDTINAPVIQAPPRAADRTALLRNDPISIEHALKLLFKPGDVIEIRALKVASGNFTNTLAGYFNDLHLAAIEAAKITTAEGIYYTANRINPALLARSANRIRRIDKADPLTSDADVTRRLLLPVDYDPQRPAKISSTDAEHQAAIDKAYQVDAEMRRNGWPEPIIIDSGNGAQAWYRVDLPAADDGLIENCLKTLDFQYSDETVKVDLTLHNPARILKLPGTVARKGDNTPDRPHRLSRILSAPAQLEIVPIEKLRELAARLPQPPTQPVRTNGNGNGSGKPFDLAAFIRDHNLEVTGPENWRTANGTAERWIFNACPWNSSHTDHSAYLMRWTDGAIAAGCHHNGCAGKTWHDLREKYEPGYRDRRNGHTAAASKNNGRIVTAPTTGTITTTANVSVTVTATNRPTISEYMAALASMGYSFRLNELTQDVEVNGAALTDNLAAEIRAKMRDAGYKGMGAIEDAYTAHAMQHAYHPIKDYFNSLTWDGNDHIDLLTMFLADKHNPFKNGDTVSHRYLRRYLVGCVGKTFDQVQTAMLVLEGPQRLGKSRLARWLASPLDRYFIEGPIDPDDKDSHIRLMTQFMWEVSELGATTRRADIEALKSFITLRDVTVRKPFGRRDVHGPAVCNLIGTLNDTGAGFLNDPTGSRRALTISLSSIDWAYAEQVDIHQVWAQAVALYRAGESPYLLAEERDVQAKINAEFELSDPVEDVLTAQFRIDVNERDWFTPSADILRIVDDNLKGTSIGHSRSISAVLKRMGIIQERPYQDGVRVRGYHGVKIKTVPTLADRLLAEQSQE